jgi:cytochrome c-type biogenesis protein CcmH/NrfF
MRIRKSLIATVLLAASCIRGSDDRMETLGQAMVCMCGKASEGCGQLLSDCNMIGCPTSGPMRRELEQQLASGRPASEILAAFSEKYGPRVLSAPPFDSWFNASAWVTPFGAMLGGGFLLALFLKRSAKPVPTNETAVNENHRKEIEEELGRHRLED